MEEDHDNPHRFRTVEFLKGHVASIFNFYYPNFVDDICENNNDDNSEEQQLKPCPSSTRINGFYHYLLDDGTVYNTHTRHLVSSTRWVVNFANLLLNDIDVFAQSCTLSNSNNCECEGETSTTPKTTTSTTSTIKTRCSLHTSSMPSKEVLLSLASDALIFLLSDAHRNKVTITCEDASSPQKVLHGYRWVFSTEEDSSKHDSTNHAYGLAFVVLALSMALKIDLNPPSCDVSSFPAVDSDKNPEIPPPTPSTLPSLTTTTLTPPQQPQQRK
eukprot:m.56847 g.56847  ORF g.56847 m.56847 type:complete len:272 (-) comp11203_c3_seq1:1789-2604(-)